MPHANWILRRIAEVLQSPAKASTDDPIFQQIELAEALTADLSSMAPAGMVKSLQYLRRLAPSVQARVLAMLMGLESPKLPYSLQVISSHPAALRELMLMQSIARGTFASSDRLAAAIAPEDLPRRSDAPVSTTESLESRLSSIVDKKAPDASTPGRKV